MSFVSWISCTTLGAAIAWTLGMIPSTIFNLAGDQPGGAPPDIHGWRLYLLASAMGLVLGAILGVAQWRVLRRHVPRASRWVGANALAWTVGMPLVFLGMGTLSDCYDLDFPEFIRQVDAAHADLLLVPASDWREIKLPHHVSATFRAIENGVTMVRATRWGLSSAVDPQGHVVALLDPLVATNQSLVAQVAGGRVGTIYARFGDWSGWLCVAGFLAACIRSLAFSRPPG